MKTSLFATLAALALATPAFAEGDPAVGEKEFMKCRACHSIIAPDGTAIVKGAAVGPNLYGVVGRPVASVEDFRYGDSIAELGAAGAVWTPEEIADYITDPTKYLRAKTGDKKAKGNMAFQLRKKQEDVVAYLQSVVTE